MLKIKAFYIAILVICAFFVAACSMIKPAEIKIVDAKIVTGLDANLMPVKITDVFPNNTSKVGCWIEWRNARINSQITVSWHYLTDDIHVLDHTLNIPKKDGTGGVILNMPEGKTLPSGMYRVELFLDKRLLKSLTFTVEKGF
ncbi:MAG: hypothetical protein PHO42_03190 [Candidatus Omnitrophica bacterium]|nr:hypothetical protein [Candidatus Omnitrophota bacterium]